MRPQVDLSISRHAQQRLQQRAVPEFMVSVLLEYGASMRHAGAEVIFMDKLARRRLRHDVGDARALAKVERWLNTYLVRGDNGALITVARRTRRLKRP
jgi:hypothetical protein